MNIIQDIYKVSLYCGNGNSDKEYNIIIKERLNSSSCILYDLVVEYGRRNTSLKKITKLTAVSITQAHNELSILRSQKENKGYHITNTKNWENDADTLKRRRISLLLFRLSKIAIPAEQNTKLFNMIYSDDDESLTLAEVIILKTLEKAVA